MVEVEKRGKTYIIPIEALSALVADSSGSLKEPNDSNGYRNVTVKNAQQLPDEYETTTPADNTDALQTVDALEQWEIFSIRGKFLMSADVATRTARIGGTYFSGSLAIAVAAKSFETSVITLTASQQGQIFMSENGVHFTNTHGTIAIVADENPLPIKMSGSSSIVAEIVTNKQTLDRSEVTIGFHRRKVV